MPDDVACATCDEAAIERVEWESVDSLALACQERDEAREQQRFYHDRYEVTGDNLAETLDQRDAARRWADRWKQMSQRARRTFQAWKRIAKVEEARAEAAEAERDAARRWARTWKEKAREFRLLRAKYRSLEREAADAINRLDPAESALAEAKEDTQTIYNDMCRIVGEQDDKIEHAEAELVELRQWRAEVDCGRGCQCDPPGSGEEHCVGTCQARAEVAKWRAEAEKNWEHVGACGQDISRLSARCHDTESELAALRQWAILLESFTGLSTLTTSYETILDYLRGVRLDVERLKRIETAAREWDRAGVVFISTAGLIPHKSVREQQDYQDACSALRAALATPQAKEVAP